MPHFFLLLFFSCSCKIPWTGKKCENKNGKINLFFFFKWKRSGHCNQEDFTAISDKRCGFKFRSTSLPTINLAVLILRLLTDNLISQSHSKVVD